MTSFADPATIFRPQQNPQGHHKLFPPTCIEPGLEIQYKSSAEHGKALPNLDVLLAQLWKTLVSIIISYFYLNTHGNIFN